MSDPGIGQPSHRRLGWLIASPAAYGLILIFGLLITWPGFRTLPAVDRDEARFAQSSRQMLESGDYLDIRLQDEPRLKKPAGIYWLQAAATAIMGGEDPANPIWTYRLPSLLGALSASMLTLVIGRRWFGADAGFVAASLLAASLLLGFEARQAKTDAFLLMTILICMKALAAAWIPGASGQRLDWRGWVPFWIALGVGILVKGPVIVMVVGLTALGLSIYDRRVGWLKRLRPWPGLAVTAAIALPWLVAITIASHGAFLSQSVGGDLASKLVAGQESHGAPPGTYLVMFPVMFWPGSLFALLALPWVWRNRRDRAVVFTLAWVIPSWIVFEAIPTKLPHYVLPLYPGIALLTGAWFMRREIEPLGKWSLTRSLAAIILWAAVGVALGSVVVAAAPLGDARLSFQGVCGGVALWVVTAAGMWAIWRGETARALGITLIGAAAAWGLVFGAALPGLDAPWIAPRLKEVLFEKMPAGHGPILIAGYSEPSAVIAFGTKTLFGSGEDAAHWLTAQPDAIAIVGRDQAGGFNSGLEADHIGAEPLGTVSGFNYAKGKRVILTLWRKAP